MQRSGQVSDDAVTPDAGEVTATVIVDAPASVVFAGFLEWERQAEWLLGTTVRLVRGDGGEGSVIEAVTRLGPALLRSELQVARVDAPRIVRVVHSSGVFRGPGVLRCTPLARERTQVVWHEWFHLPRRPGGAAARSLLWSGSKVGMRHSLRRFAGLVEAGVLR